MKNTLLLLCITLQFILTTTLLTAQVDTIYILGNGEKYGYLDQVALDEIIDKERKKIQEDSIRNNLAVKFRLSYERLTNDTLFLHGGISFTTLSLLNDSQKEDILFNKKMPPFAFTDLNGLKISSDELLGKVVLINFWFTRCAPCIEEMPYLNIIKTDYAEEEVIFLSMAPENDEKVKKFFSKHEFTFRHIADAGQFMKNFGNGFPKNILIDKTGRVKYIDSGILGATIEIDEHGNEIMGFELNWDHLRANLDKLLSE